MHTKLAFPKEVSQPHHNYFMCMCIACAEYVTYFCNDHDITTAAMYVNIPPMQYNYTYSASYI